MNAPILIFPGQATEQVGMGRGFEADPHWKAVLESAEGLTRLPLRRLMAQGPAEALRAQRVAPCAVLAHSVGLFVSHRAAGMPLPAGASGHSMGFFSAVVAAGVVPLDAALGLILATEDLAEERFGAGTMGMAFVIGLNEAEVRGLLSMHPGLCLSNLNGQAQFTVSGPRAELDAFIEGAAPSALKSGLLPVRHPLHCEHMSPLLPRIKDRLAAWNPADPRFPLVSPLDGRVIKDGFEAWEEAIVSVASAINWPRAVKGLKEFGNAFFECGFGPQLMNLTRWADRGITVENLSHHRAWD